MKKRREFGELESLILQEIKKKNKASVGEVQSVFKGVAYTTIMTVMNRLFEKGVLSREKEGRSFIYSLKEESSYFSNVMQKFKEKIFGGKTAEMVSYLLNSSDISKEEIETIEALIKKAKKSCK